MIVDSHETLGTCFHIICSQLAMSMLVQLSFYGLNDKNRS